MPYDKAKIAEMVRSGRLAKGYTQLKLSELTHISLRSIQRIENGDVAPRVFTLNLLADQLNFNTADALMIKKIAGSTATPGDAARTINRPLQLILSVGTALLLLLFSAAFLSQTRRFPETNFESFSFWGMVVLGYMLVLWRIWR